jgi:hypothetical protein
LLPELLPLLHLTDADQVRLAALYSVDKGPVAGAEDGGDDHGTEDTAVKQVCAVPCVLCAVLFVLDCALPCGVLFCCAVCVCAVCALACGFFSGGLVDARRSGASALCTPRAPVQLMESLTELNASDVARAGRPRGLNERRMRLVDDCRELAHTADACGLSGAGCECRAGAGCCPPRCIRLVRLCTRGSCTWCAHPLHGVFGWGAGLVPACPQRTSVSQSWHRRTPRWPPSTRRAGRRGADRPRCLLRGLGWAPLPRTAALMRGAPA